MDDAINNTLLDGDNVTWLMGNDSLYDDNITYIDDEHLSTLSLMSPYWLYALAYTVWIVCIAQYITSRRVRAVLDPPVDSVLAVYDHMRMHVHSIFYVHIYIVLNMQI